MIIDLSQYKTEKELREFAEQLVQTNLVLQNNIKDLEEKLTHLEGLLKNVPSQSVEEQVLLREIKYLDESSRLSPLDLNETKQLTMLVNALIALRRKEPVKEDKKDSKPVKVADLLSIVRNVDDNEQNN